MTRLTGILLLAVCSWIMGSESLIARSRGQSQGFMDSDPMIGNTGLSADFGKVYRRGADIDAVAEVNRDESENHIRSNEGHRFNSYWQVTTAEATDATSLHETAPGRGFLTSRRA